MAELLATFSELSRSMARDSCVIAIRYHNVMCALRLGKPTMSLGYAGKHVVLMEEMGLGEFCQSANSLDLDLLIKQFTELKRGRRNCAGSSPNGTWPTPGCSTASSTSWTGCCSPGRPVGQAS